MMRRLYALSLLLLIAAGPAPLLPDDKLTPGAVATTDKRVVCRSGYSASVRHTTAKMRAEAFRKYGIDPRSGRFEADHRVPLELGGADVQANLWPQSYTATTFNAHTKDKLENRLRSLVCSGRMSLPDAQRVFLGDWIAGYREYFRQP
jgi:hypothetical protein